MQHLACINGLPCPCPHTGAVRAIELVAIWWVRLAPAVLLMRPPMMPRRCDVTHHVSKTNQPLESLHRPSSIPVHQPRPESGQHRFVIQRSTPNSYLRNDFRGAGVAGILSGNRSSTSTSRPTAIQSYRCPGRRRRNAVRLGCGAVQSPFESRRIKYSGIGSYWSNQPLVRAPNTG